MKRRTFAKSIMASLLVPCLDLRPTVDREALLAAFADAEGHRSYRYDMQQPFEHDGLAWATDGTAGVRAVLAHPPHSGEEKRLPPLPDVFRAGFVPGSRWVSLDGIIPSVRGKYHGICPGCGNRRKSMGDTYPDVDWLQSRDASDLDYDIEDNTIRDPSCVACGGRPYEGPTLCVVEGAHIEYWHLRRVLALPNAEVCVSRGDFPNAQGSWPHAICFRGDGFEGIHMGVRND